MKLPEKPPGKEERKGPGYFKDWTAMIEDRDFGAQLAAIEKEYPYWDSFKYKVKALPYDARRIWLFNKAYRNRNVTRIKIAEDPGFEFKYNTPPHILRYLHEFDLHLGGKLEGRGIIPEEEKTRYLISSIMEEAIASSQLEGAATTREIAKEMLRSNRKPTNHSEKMILNNYRTMQKALELKGKKLTPEMILLLHASITKDTLEDAANEGRFRDNDKVEVVDRITGDVFYSPPHYAKIGEWMENLCDFANGIHDIEFIHPIIRGILLHFLIGYIHPFVDGNGRTARTLFYWYLLSQGYWLIEFMSISRIILRAPAGYSRAYLYSEYDENDVTYFIDYNLRSMDAALKSLQEYINRKVRERKQLYALIRNEPVNERQAEILRIMLTDGGAGLTIKSVQNRFGVVYQTARMDLLGLQTMGYLTEKRMGKKMMFFRADDFERKLEHGFGD
jgi:Fic family protein